MCWEAESFSLRVSDPRISDSCSAISQLFVQEQMCFLNSWAKKTQKISTLPQELAHRSSGIELSLARKCIYFGDYSSGCGWSYPIRRVWNMKTSMRNALVKSQVLGFRFVASTLHM
jgi:hypothetical protein